VGWYEEGDLAANDRFCQKVVTFVSLTLPVLRLRTQVLRRQDVGYNAVTSPSKLESFRMSAHQGAFTEPRLSTPLLLGIVHAANGTPDEFYYLGLAQEKQDKLDPCRSAAATCGTPPEDPWPAGQAG
jgi:hypothetical protein